MTPPSRKVFWTLVVVSAVGSTLVAEISCHFLHIEPPGPQIIGCLLAMAAGNIVAQWWIRKQRRGRPR